MLVLFSPLRKGTPSSNHGFYYRVRNDSESCFCGSVSAKGDPSSARKGGVSFTPVVVLIIICNLNSQKHQTKPKLYHHDGPQPPKASPQTNKGQTNAYPKANQGRNACPICGDSSLQWCGPTKHDAEGLVWKLCSTRIKYGVQHYSDRL